RRSFVLVALAPLASGHGDPSFRRKPTGHPSPRGSVGAIHFTATVGRMQSASPLPGNGDSLAWARLEPLPPAHHARGHPPFRLVTEFGLGAGNVGLAVPDVAGPRRLMNRLDRGTEQGVDLVDQLQQARAPAAGNVVDPAADARRLRSAQVGLDDVAD